MKLRIVFYVFFLGILFSACSLEHKMAMEFMKHDENKGAVLVVPPFSLEMYNNNKYNFDSLYIPKDFPLDSILFTQTELLKQVSDSVFLESYLNAFIQNLSKLGFQVYLPDELEAFYQAESPAYIFRFAQLELNEAISPFDIKEEISGNYYACTFNLNMVMLNNWFEFEARDTTWKKVFYTEDSISDNVTGSINIERKTKTPVIYYSLDTLKVENIYQLAKDVGKKYAGYFSDYLMNEYIEKHFPANKNPTFFFQYDAELKMLFPYAEGFQEITLRK